VQALPEAERPYADFGRPVFITAVFWLLVKKNKVPRVEKADILHLAVADEAEFGRVVSTHRRMGLPKCFAWEGRLVKGCNHYIT
jgi:hypothetical protein